MKIIIILSLALVVQLLRYLPDQKNRQSTEPVIEEETQTAATAPMTEKERKAKLATLDASSEREYIRHRLEQIDRLIEIAMNEQEKTIANGKEWIKYEKEIMRLENQAQALHRKDRKAKAILDMAQ